MDELPQMNLPAFSQNAKDKSQRIENTTVSRLLHSARRVVEDIAWKDGVIWYPDDIHRRSPPSELTDFVFPDRDTPAARACAQEIRDYTGDPLNEEEARQWLTEKIEERLYKYVAGARDKIEKVRLVVNEAEIEVRAERPITTRTTVGPAPWSSSL